MNSQIGEVKSGAETLARITWYIVIPIIMLCLILSLYCGWKSNAVLTGQLLSRKTLEIIVNPDVLVKFMKWGYFQFLFFLVGIISFGVCFLISLVHLISTEVKHPLHPYVGFAFILFFFLILWVTIYLINRYQEYSKVENEITEIRKEKKSSAVVQDGTKKFSETTLKELIYAAKDIRKLLINWALLLLTGLGYIMMRIMKFIE